MRTRRLWRRAVANALRRVARSAGSALPGRRKGHARIRHSTPYGRASVVICRQGGKVCGAARVPRSGMGEDVLFVPAEQVELDAGRQEAEAGLRRAPSRPSRSQHARRAGLERVQIEHVGGGIFELRVASASAAPQSEICCCLEMSTSSSSRPGPSARAGRYRCAPAARRSWCTRPARPRRRAMLAARRCRSGRNGRSSQRRDRPAAVQIRRLVWPCRSGRRRRCRRRARAARRRAGRGPDSAPSSRYRPPPRRDREIIAKVALMHANRVQLRSPCRDALISAVPGKTSRDG